MDPIDFKINLEKFNRKANRSIKYFNICCVSYKTVKKIKIRALCCILYSMSLNMDLLKIQIYLMFC
jgi:hypothetical protein